MYLSLRSTGNFARRIWLCWANIIQYIWWRATKSPLFQDWATCWAISMSLKTKQLVLDSMVKVVSYDRLVEPYKARRTLNNVRPSILSHICLISLFVCIWMFYNIFDTLSKVGWIPPQVDPHPFYLTPYVRSHQKCLFFRKGHPHPFSPHQNLNPISKNIALLFLVLYNM